ncbi:MAG: class II fructose-bisphosphatase [Acidimicrobiales bacterium]
MARESADGTATAPLDGVVLDLLVASQQAAAACQAWVGRGDKEAADDAAVAAMRQSLASAGGQGEVAIGEGVKDDAPMLYVGEKFGVGPGPVYEIAVDPLEGTTLCARGATGAIAVIAAAPAGSLYRTEGHYMDKLIVGPEAAGVIDIDDPAEDNLRRIAEALGRPLASLLVGVLDKPRHVELIGRLRDLGVGVVLVTDGDVMTGLSAMVPSGALDVALGVGGAPEGVITACAARALGAGMQGRLVPQSDEERTMLDDLEPGWDRTLRLNDMVRADDAVLVATAVTSAWPMNAPEPAANGGTWLSSLVCARRIGQAFVRAEVYRAEPTP